MWFEEIFEEYEIRIKTGSNAYEVVELGYLCQM